jgi:hypothetical protein
MSVIISMRLWREPPCSAPPYICPLSNSPVLTLSHEFSQFIADHTFCIHQWQTHITAPSTPCMTRQLCKPTSVQSGQSASRRVAREPSHRPMENDSTRKWREVGWLDALISAWESRIFYNLEGRGTTRPWLMGCWASELAFALDCVHIETWYSHGPNSYIHLLDVGPGIFMDKICCTINHASSD